jgi:hypothetical protein
VWSSGKEFPWKQEVQDVSVWEPSRAVRGGGKGREGKGKERKGREGKGREGKGHH